MTGPLDHRRAKALHYFNVPPPIKVELVPHDPAWAREAELEAERLRDAIGPTLVALHHIGSTAIPGIVAKSILDLMPVVSSLDELDDRRQAVEALGYEWWGELGIEGRRYCSNSDATSGRRLVQLHCFVERSPHIARHLAFRDYLRSHPDIALAYDGEKRRCQSLHPDDSHAYGDCKSDRIVEIEAAALSWWHSHASSHAPLD
ncbi:MAG: GrpB family protein [Verrucomicrobiaceae bacterium]|nr:GrpB family protein [Verrucomicrobiaceae bacterium]